MCRRRSLQDAGDVIPVVLKLGVTRLFIMRMFTACIFLERKTITADFLGFTVRCHLANQIERELVRSWSFDSNKLGTLSAGWSVISTKICCLWNRNVIHVSSVTWRMTKGTALIDNLQNYCLGSSRGKSRLPRWLSRWLHSHLHWENDQRLHSSSVFPSEVAAVCLVVFGSLFSSLLWCRLETTGLFGANESAIKEHQVSVYSLSDVEDIRVCARLHREPCQVGNRFALFHVLPTLIFLHIFLFPVTSETASRSLSRGWRCSAVSRALPPRFCRSSPTETGQSPRSSMSMRLPCCGRQKQVKLAMDVVKRKEAMQEKSENDARKDWVATWKKPEGWNKLKRVAALLWLAGALEWTSTS